MDNLQENNKRLKGDPEHPFVATITRLLENKKDMRAHIIRARKVKMLGSVMGRMGEATRDDTLFSDIPEACVRDQTIHKTVPADVLNSFKTGRLAPHLYEIDHIALDHGLDGAKRTRFCKSGEEYVAHCVALNMARLEEKPSHVKKIKIKHPLPRASEQEPKTELQRALFEMINHRWFEPYRGSIS